MKNLTTKSKNMSKIVRHQLKTASIPIFQASMNQNQNIEHRSSTTSILNRQARKWMKFCWKSLDMARVKVTSGSITALKQPFWKPCALMMLMAWHFLLIICSNDEWSGENDSNKIKAQFYWLIYYTFIIKELLIRNIEIMFIWLE